MTSIQCLHALKNSFIFFYYKRNFERLNNGNSENRRTNKKRITSEFIYQF